ncbi:MAG: cyclic lactone autoinducer peptide [Turicibacter sp.]
MKTMKKNLMNQMKQGIAKSIGHAALKTGESAIDRECIGFVYEPQVPTELLLDKGSDK